MKLFFRPDPRRADTLPSAAACASLPKRTGRSAMNVRYIVGIILLALLIYVVVIYV